MKYFLKQEEHLQQIRTQITSTVSIQKKLLLDPSLTVKEWLIRLKEDTEPSKNFIIRKVQLQYTDSLEGLKQTKINQWLDQWEHAMKIAEKHELPQMHNGIWLMDLANAIRPISETYFVLYTKQANDTEKAHSSGYLKVATELREAFQNLSKVVPTMARGNAFNADYA